ncbi:hypothetical protein PV10_06954 [Exophiala mesophila]|uniref:Tyrosyl-DNA phosphodiesterase n=1 Tax=Exophiala mesophila TaxID=212818 RepID=A0A0D1Z6Q4_EXOME|nr:uncharacterized protein PV10_06954 [Exophiala mesophila]KIV89564.1 hypothetical protein PV10_06954 [Exophiala mesophila]
MDSRPSKRQKRAASPVLGRQSNSTSGTMPDAASIRKNRSTFLDSISRSISPPKIQRSTSVSEEEPSNAARGSSEVKQSPHQPIPRPMAAQTVQDVPSSTGVKFISSPFKLTTIRDLPGSQNVDTIGLSDILGDPLIREAWVFNFCFDVDWLMDHFDPDIRSMVKVKIVHGSWRREDDNRIGIEDACRRWPNVEALTAYLPDPFGTHHSKMFVLFTHDDHAQIIIHTANMLAQDWTNMTQAVWKSPKLPKTEATTPPQIGKIGSGTRFKHDILAYLFFYGSKTRNLREQLLAFDFRAVRGALIASVPTKMPESVADSQVDLQKDLWGYPSLARALRSISHPDLEHPSSKSTSHLVMQVSSIATLSPKWLERFLAAVLEPRSSRSLTALTGSPARFLRQTSIIYPTPVNVATSLDGYASGRSIHTKAQSPAHFKQIELLRTSWCQWARGPNPAFRAWRHEAAPHIKTYVQFRSRPSKETAAPEIDWALLTSANLSTQAWGSLQEKEGQIVVKSFEIGVLVWPELFTESLDDDEAQGLPPSTLGANVEFSNLGDSKGKTASMIPVFGSDNPPWPELPFHLSSNTNPTSTLGQTPPSTIIGLRIPYDLPLTAYPPSGLPWSPNGPEDSLDRHGRRWPRDFIR